MLNQNEPTGDHMRTAARRTAIRGILESTTIVSQAGRQVADSNRMAERPKRTLRKQPHKSQVA